MLGEVIMGKNWTGIVAIDNANLRLAIAQIPEDDDLAARLRQIFPECFTTNDDEGPVPLSLIMKKHAEMKCDGTHGADEKALEALNVPFVRWSLTEENYKSYPDWMEGLLSLEYQKAHKISFGSVIPINGYDYVIVREDGEEIVVTPVERVAADITKLPWS